MCRLFPVAIAVLLAGAARAECVMNRAAVLPITLWQNKLIVPVTVNGVAERFFVDTGAAVTTLSDSLANALNIPRDFDHTIDMFGVAGRESHLYLGEVQSISVGGVEVKKHAFPVASFGAFMLADGRSHADGLIGADILSHFDVDIDIPHRQIAFWRVQGCSVVKPDWHGDASGVPMQISSTRNITVPVRIDGATLDLMLDTGAGDLLLSTRAAARAGATPEVLEESRQSTGFGVNDRSYPVWLHIFRRVELGTQVYGDVRAVVVARGRYIDQGDGLLGVAFLKRGRVWISYSTGTFFAEASGG
jgi:predicted aspartyl protease